MELVIYDTPEDVADGVADHIARLIEHSSGQFTLGLAGGTTPRATYLSLGRHAPGWDRVVAWLSDERWVPYADERSNGAMAARALLDDVPARFERPEWSEEMTPGESATSYEAMLRSLHQNHRPDLVLLGMGSDGHTASLFPGSRALDERERWFVANEIPETGESRLTATYPLLWEARRLLVITTGEAKAAAVKDSIDGKTPAGWIDDGEAEVEWHIDLAAASLVS